MGEIRPDDKEREEWRRTLGSHTQAARSRRPPRPIRAVVERSPIGGSELITSHLGIQRVQTG